MEDIRKYDSKYFRNRELSWLQFDERVLLEATDETNPLFERMRFLGIFLSNLDEFTVVRIATLKDMEHAGYKENDIAGMDPTVCLSLLSQKIRPLLTAADNIFLENILPKLKEVGVNLIISAEDLSKIQKAYVQEYFDKYIGPVITPFIVDGNRPFPLVKSGTTYVCALVNDKKTSEWNIAMAGIPDNLNRLVEISAGGSEHFFIPIEEVVKLFFKKILNVGSISSIATFRIHRNADLSIDNEDAEDLLLKIENSLHQREWGEIIRFDYSDNMKPDLFLRLRNEFKVSNKGSFKIKCPVDYRFIEELYGLPGFEEYKEKAFTPVYKKYDDIFRAIKEKDILLITPFESFDTVVDFVKAAARDEKVVAIKQTLYRVGADSPIVKALVDAVHRGKAVTVMVELKARFEEEKNIGWARMLEREGCNVIYGSINYKTHGKMTLVMRKEENKVCQYLHLGTGNYNTNTAKRYTDISLLTRDEKLAKDAQIVFTRLGGIDTKEMTENGLLVAPYSLKNELIRLIDREISNAKEGKKAAITAKMNSLCDREMICKLYDASNAGVKINLIVRGICCLKTGIPGVSENITVRSIVGRFLEHNRIFKFENGGNPEYYCGSADWMPRNLERRVEIVFPIKDDDAKKKTDRYLEDILKDTVKGRELKSDGTYYKVPDGGKAYSYQADYINRSEI